MDIVPREPAIFGGVKKAIKKVGKTVKKVAKSPIGKAALLYAGTAGLGALGAGAARAGSGFGLFAPSNVLANLSTTGSNIAGLFASRQGPTSLRRAAQEVGLPKTRFGKFLAGAKDAITGSGNIGKLATLGAVSTFLTKTLGMPPEQAEAELARDPSTYLRQYYTNLNPNASEEEIQTFVTTNTSEYAVGGRVGFADGPVLPPDTTQPVNPFGPKPGDFGIEEDIPIKMASNIENDKILEALFEKYLDMGLSPKDAAKAAQEEFERMSMMKTEGRGLAALGGRMNYSEGTDEKIKMIKDMLSRGADDDTIMSITGASQAEIDQIKNSKAMGGKMDTASDNAMQAAGIEGLPVRQNPKGVKELDLRKTGGFIPPVGIKEKEDDIPAMLSNNEFVMTADAVRGMGDGDVNLGAQRMYDQMKMLEAGGKV
jgi:hypothetical protein